MNRRALLKTAGTAAIGAGLSGFPIGWPARAASNAPKKILMFTRSQTFEHPSIKREVELAYVRELEGVVQVVEKKGEKKPDAGLGWAEKVLTDLGAKHGFEVTATKDGGVFTAANIAQYDAFFFYTTGDLTKPGGDGNPPMSPEGKQAFLDAIHSGKAFLGTHSASDTFHGPGDVFDPKPPAKLDPYAEMIGGEFIRHGPQQVARMRAADTKFPGVSPIGDGFDINDEWYAIRNFQPNLHVVLVQETKGMKGTDYQRPPYPATWARMHGKGRVFYTSMGHRADVWSNPNFQSILLGGLAWALGAADADVSPNIEQVAPHASDIPVEALARPEQKK
jgi:type 1 glutamine amidotransferase